MRIDLQSGTQAAPESERSNSRNSVANSPTSAAKAPSLGEDQAQLSGAHVEVQALTAQASQLPEVREERVQSLRQAIHTGEYQVDPLKIAGALFSSIVTSPAA
jgi:flagellar biosynthesis anti-sigma factor FlgM